MEGVGGRGEVDMKVAEKERKGIIPTPPPARLSSLLLSLKVCELLGS